ncbi:hypothetical protein M0R45_005469 [Rubus argutus]|uniref:SCP domain-containing protein n=1 Tax=Rubus argutus TaxID=59490 RepID=A0AAW1YMQ4_RUBAR
MGFSKQSLSALCSLAIFILVIHVPLASSVQDDSGFLKAHNKARAEAGVPPLQWNETIAEFAQNSAEKRAEDCTSENSKGPYAENILSSNGDTTGKEAVKLWTANKCTAAEPPTAEDGCHYAKVVSKRTTQLGCARVWCKNGNMLLKCDYGP